MLAELGHHVGLATGITYTANRHRSPLSPEVERGSGVPIYVERPYLDGIWLLLKVTYASNHGMPPVCACRSRSTVY